MGLNPARVACEGFFSTDVQKALSIQCYTHVGVGQNEINHLQLNRTAHEPIIIQ